MFIVYMKDQGDKEDKGDKEVQGDKDNRCIVVNNI